MRSDAADTCSLNHLESFYTFVLAKWLINDSNEIKFTIKPIYEIADVIKVPPDTSMLLLCNSLPILKSYDKMKYPTYIDYIKSFINRPCVYFTYFPSRYSKLLKRNLWTTDTVVQMNISPNYFVRYLPNTLMPK